MPEQEERTAKIAELEAEILRLEGLNEADRRRLREEPGPLEIFDPWSELTHERDGAEADAIAEQHERDRLGY